jgi:F0F1-type ATP synthase epsilon subunit
MLNCKILSPQKIKQYRDFKSMVLPAWSGQLQILQGHAEIFMLLKEGTISIKKGTGEEEIIQIPEGECHVKDDDIKIFL